MLGNSTVLMYSRISYYETRMTPLKHGIETAARSYLQLIFTTAKVLPHIAGMMQAWTVIKRISAFL